MYIEIVELKEVVKTKVTYFIVLSIEDRSRFDANDTVLRITLESFYLKATRWFLHIHERRCETTTEMARPRAQTRQTRKGLEVVETSNKEP